MLRRPRWVGCSAYQSSGRIAYKNFGESTDSSDLGRGVVSRGLKSRRDMHTQVRSSGPRKDPSGLDGLGTGSNFCMFEQGCS